MCALRSSTTYASSLHKDEMSRIREYRIVQFFTGIHINIHPLLSGTRPWPEQLALLLLHLHIVRRQRRGWMWNYRTRVPLHIFVRTHTHTPFQKSFQKWQWECCVGMMFNVHSRRSLIFPPFLHSERVDVVFDLPLTQPANRSWNMTRLRTNMQAHTRAHTHVTSTFMYKRPA